MTLQYTEFRDLYVKKHPESSLKANHEKANEIWKTIKSSPNFDDDYKNQMTKLKNLEVKGTISSFFASMAKKKPSTTTSLSTSVNEPGTSVQFLFPEKDVSSSSEYPASPASSFMIDESSSSSSTHILIEQDFSMVEDSNTSMSASSFAEDITMIEDDETSFSANDNAASSSAIESRHADDSEDSSRAATKQESLKADIIDIDAKIHKLLLAKNKNLLDDVSLGYLEKLQKQKAQLHAKLSRLQKGQKASRKHRLAVSSKLKMIAEKHPDLMAGITPRDKPGRPSLNETHPELMQLIENIAKQCGLADARRRSDTIRTIHTVKHLTTAVNASIPISRTAVYYRLEPPNPRTLDGRRHVTTVPVRMLRATNDHHKSHSDTYFAKATIDHCNQLASFIGPGQSIVISMDDKAKVALGVAAVKKQKVVMMHTRYKLNMDDHDFIVAPKHKLTPSVIAAQVIETDFPGSKDQVKYSGEEV